MSYINVDFFILDQHFDINVTHKAKHISKNCKVGDTTNVNYFKTPQKFSRKMSLFSQKTVSQCKNKVEV